MGKVDFFVVEFYGGKRIFCPGEELNGTLRLKVNKELKLRGLRIEFHGKAQVHGFEFVAVGEERNATFRRYTNSETYFDTLVTLFGKGPGESGDDPVLQPGEYSYPFQFLIPNLKMPTSVEARRGYVRYWLKGIIDRPWRFDITTTAAFTMIEDVDINTPQLLQPRQAQEDRNVGCLCCVSGPLSMIFYTDRGGYCPGESIGVSAVINNNSKRDVVGLEIELIQITVYISQVGMPSKQKDKVTSMFQELKVKAGKEICTPMWPFPVPPLPPSMLNCHCMKMHYLLRLKVLVKGAFNSTLNIPIIIGSVPYQPPLPAPSAAVPPTAPPMAGFEGAPAYPPAATQYGDNTQPYPNNAPPSYAECVNGGASINDEGD